MNDRRDSRSQIPPAPHGDATIPEPFDQRRRRPEWMDDPALDADAHRHALGDLARLNRWTGSAAVLWRTLEPLLRRTAGSPARVLDIACGGGDVTVALAGRARRAGRHLRMVGCDRSERALDTARRRGEQAGLEIDWFRRDVTRESLPGGFDIVVSTLFLHHLDAARAAALLHDASHAADHLRFIDLERGRRGWHLARAGTWLLSRSPVVRVDGPRSVEGAFTPAEALALARAAGLHDAAAPRCWPARFVLRWDRADASHAL